MAWGEDVCVLNYCCSSVAQSTFAGVLLPVIISYREFQGFYRHYHVELLLWCSFILQAPSGTDRLVMVLYLIGTKTSIKSSSTPNHRKTAYIFNRISNKDVLSSKIGLNVIHDWQTYILGSLWLSVTSGILNFLCSSLFFYRVIPI